MICHFMKLCSGPGPDALTRTGVTASTSRSCCISTKRLILKNLSVRSLVAHSPRPSTRTFLDPSSIPSDDAREFLACNATPTPQSHFGMTFRNPDSVSLKYRYSQQLPLRVPRAQSLNCEISFSHRKSSPCFPYARIRSQSRESARPFPNARTPPTSPRHHPHPDRLHDHRRRLSRQSPPRTLH
jgi:hypothetical protein